MSEGDRLNQREQREINDLVTSDRGKIKPLAIPVGKARYFLQNYLLFPIPKQD